MDPVIAFLKHRYGLDDKQAATLAERVRNGTATGAKQLEQAAYQFVADTENTRMDQWRIAAGDYKTGRMGGARQEMDATHRAGMQREARAVDVGPALTGLLGKPDVVGAVMRGRSQLASGALQGTADAAKSVYGALPSIPEQPKPIQFYVDENGELWNVARSYPEFDTLVQPGPDSITVRHRNKVARK